MRSAKETGCFPYSSQVVCFMELFPNGDIKQLNNDVDKFEAYCNANQSKSKIVAVWPGKWRSDLFIIDDLEKFAEALDFEKILLGQRKI